MAVDRPKKSWLPFQQVRRSLRKISGMRIRNEDDGEHYLAPRPPSKQHEEYPREPDTCKTSRENLEATADPQSLSQLFTRLPLEIRRLIYAQLWRDHLGHRLRLHIHSSSDENLIQHTPCVVDSDIPTCEDPWGVQPFPGGVHGRTAGEEAPDWFWWAWCLRMRWGRHWECQKHVMSRWAEQSEWTRIERSPYMAIFLTCKKMYIEAIQSFFGTATLCFTGSEDANNFLVRNSHRYQNSIRNLDFSFSHHKDHLFLFSIEAKHPRLSRCSGIGVGLDAWTNLMSAVRRSIPELRSLQLLIDNRLPGPEPEFWSVFAAWQPQILTIELPPIHKKYTIRHGRASSASGSLPSVLRLLNSTTDSAE